MKILLTLFFLLLFSSNALSGTIYGCVSGNCINGFGQYLYQGGDRYTGFWKDGIRYGRAIYRFADGSSFTGSYANDRRHGTGTYTSSNGQEINGHWMNGLFVNPQRLKKLSERDSVIAAATDSIAIRNVDQTDADTPLASEEPAAVDEADAALLQAEAMRLIKACTGYTDDMIKELTYLRSVPHDDFNNLYFKFRAYNTGSYKRLAGVLEFTLKFKKYHSGAYEQGIDTGKYYWSGCEDDVAA